MLVVLKIHIIIILITIPAWLVIKFLALFNVDGVEIGGWVGIICFLIINYKFKLNLFNLGIKDRETAWERLGLDHSEYVALKRERETDNARSASESEYYEEMQDDNRRR